MSDSKSYVTHATWGSPPQHTGLLPVRDTVMGVTIWASCRKEMSNI